jgi:hypothetical protein
MVQPGVTGSRDSAGENLGLLRGEPLLRENSLDLQLTELLELLQPVLGRRGRAPLRLLVLRLRFGLRPAWPLLVLTVLDATADGGCRSGNHGRACDSAEKSHVSLLSVSMRRAAGLPEPHCLRVHPVRP